MFNFLKRKAKAPGPYQGQIDELIAQCGPYWEYPLRDSAVGKKILALEPEEQRQVAFALLDWLEVHNKYRYDRPDHLVFHAFVELLRLPLPFQAGEICDLLDWSIKQPMNYYRGISQMVRLLENYQKQTPLTDEIVQRIEQLLKAIASENMDAGTRKWAVRLKDLLPQEELPPPINPGEAWSDVALFDLEDLDPPARAAWLELLRHCQKASGTAPSQKWLRSAQLMVEKIGSPAFRSALLRWFPLVDRPRTQPIASWSRWEADPNAMIDSTNGDLLKALAWLCASQEDREIARALTYLALSTYRKVPNIGPRCMRVGNACVWALGAMPGTAGVEGLALLKIKVKAAQAQKGIEAGLQAAATRLGLPAEEIEEMTVPAYGLDPVGLRSEQFGEYTAELAVKGTTGVEIHWYGASPGETGARKAYASTPKAVKEQHAEELKELVAAQKDIRKMLPAQRSRIESLYLESKRWELPTWRERYLDHPLVGTLARRLIWKFSRGDQAGSGIWLDDQIVDRDGRPLDWLDDTTHVELWHPISVDPQAVLEWRSFLAEHEIQQPFKQAHREVYLLTDAELETRIYSNRFAAHILKQHQFNALCGERGWKNRLRLMVDDIYPPASRLIPAYGLRAEFWVEGAGDTYGRDTTEVGTYLYLATDQVRFYPEGAAELQAHALGGAYTVGFFTRAPDPLPLEQVPALVFSEILRDVDLFVGVCSVGNDPNWSDGGPEGRYQHYWNNYSFGDLSETAKMRKQVLESLLPRLKIASRCQLTERFLVVRGDLRTYKIHLGSGNILMEPNDQYLCIVPGRGQQDPKSGERLFLPFEGDSTLAIILSKAFLLADDKTIKDPTIKMQLRLRA